MKREEGGKHTADPRTSPRIKRVYVQLLLEEGEGGKRREGGGKWERKKKSESGDVFPSPPGFCVRFVTGADWVCY